MFSKFVVALSITSAVAATNTKAVPSDAMLAKIKARNLHKKMKSTMSGDRKSAIKMAAEATSWVQYSLYGGGSNCAGDAHYLYWQAADTCVEAEYIPGYTSSNDNYVKVTCSQVGDQITLSNQYYSDSSCVTAVNARTVVVNATCQEQETGAFNANINTAIDDDSYSYDQYVTIIGNQMATACVSDVTQPWNEIDNPNGLVDILYDTFDCSGYPAAADLFIYNVCSKQDQTASTLGEYVKLSDCDENNYQADFAYYDDSECSGTRVTNQEIFIWGRDLCGYTSSATNSVGSANDDSNYCLGKSGAASVFAFNAAGLVGVVAFAAAAVALF